MIFSLNGSVRNYQLCLHSCCLCMESLSLSAVQLRGRWGAPGHQCPQVVPNRKRSKGRREEREGGREGGGTKFRVVELMKKLWWHMGTSTKRVASVSNYHALLSDRGRWWKCPRCVNDSIVFVTTYSANVVNDSSISQSCTCVFLKHTKVRKQGFLMHHPISKH